MSNAEERNLYIQKQQRWLLFLRHCAKCQLPEQECQFGRSCRVGKELWQHILNCNVPQGQTCEYPRCHSSKDLLKHHQKCQVSCASMSAILNVDTLCTPANQEYMYNFSVLPLL
jgi:hypothetical protein